jgi:hypothetical protein
MTKSGAFMRREILRFYDWQNARGFGAQTRKLRAALFLWLSLFFVSS